MSVGRVLFSRGLPLLDTECSVKLGSEVIFALLTTTMMMMVMHFVVASLKPIFFMCFFLLSSLKIWNLFMGGGGFIF